MSSQNDPDFQMALQFDLDREGRYYENVPGDSGGPTKWGITWEDGNRWRQSHGMPGLSLDQARYTKLDYLTPDVIANIYFTHYWLPMMGAELPSPLDITLFDGAVNMGTSQVVKFLQRVLGVKDDGQLGPQTKSALDIYLAKHGQEPLCVGIQARREEFYKNLADRKPQNKQFLGGWLNRNGFLNALIQKLLRK